MPSFSLTPTPALSLKPDHSVAAEACLVVEERKEGTLFLLMAKKASQQLLAEKIRTEFDLELPRSPKATYRNDVGFIWAGPSQWLVLGSGVESAKLGQRLQNSAAGAASITDQSDGRTILRISGARARDILAKGVHIDLHPRAFRPSDTAMTSVSYMNVQFWQVDAGPTYELVMFRSFAEAFAEWLAAAASEYGRISVR